MRNERIHKYPPTAGRGRKRPAFHISLFLALGFSTFAGLAPATVLEEKGEALFEEKCLPCHTIGRGDGVGPDLKGVTKKRDRAWLVAFIKSPGEMFDKGDPIATALLEKFKGIRMPASGLTETEIARLLSYLDREDIAQPETAAGPSPVSAERRPEGDALRGMQLFTGAIPLEMGGAPCIACHSIAGVAALGGGTLGPDLSETFEDYGGEELFSVLSTVPFPTMKPIYDDHPLQARELAHLTAFMGEAGDRKVTGSIGQFCAMVGGIFLATVALTWLLWRNRLRNVRRALVEKSRKGRGG